MGKSDIITKDYVKVSPMNLSDEEIDQFHTNMREIMLFSKYSKDKKKLQELLCQDERFQMVERNAARVIKAVTNVSLELKEEEEVVDVCQAWEEMREDARLEGREVGEKVGEKVGREAERMAFVRKMLGAGRYTIEEIAELSEFSVDEVKTIKANI